MSDFLLTDEEIETWLENRLGKGNRFEQLNRQFCKDLTEAQDAKTKKKLAEWLEGKDKFLDGDLSLLLPDAEYRKVTTRELQALKKEVGLEEKPLTSPIGYVDK